MQALPRPCEHALRRLTRSSDSGIMCPNRLGCQRRSPVPTANSAANTSAVWYDQFADKMALAPLDFTFDYITRSGRVDMDRLRALSPGFMAAYEAHLAEVTHETDR